MLETQSFNPEESVKSPSPHRKKISSLKSPEELGAALATADQAIKAEKTKRALESKDRMLKRFDRGTAEIAVKKAEANKASMTELRGKLKNREKEKAKHDEFAKVVKIYQEGGEEKMNQYLFEESDSKNRLTQEQLKSDPKAQEFLKKMFSEDGLEQTFDDFVVSLPTEQDYVENIVEKIKRTSSEPSAETTDVLAEIKQMKAPVEAREEIVAAEGVKEKKRSRLITSEENTSVSGEINNEPESGKRVTNKNVIKRAVYEAPAMEKFKSDLQPLKESRSGEARVAYVKAYREYDPRFTTNKPDNLIAKTKPPFFSFGKAARELKRLHGVMVRAEESSVGGLTPEARKAIVDSARKEEEKFIESNKDLAPKK